MSDISRQVLRQIQRKHVEGKTDSDIASSVGGYSARQIRRIRFDEGWVSDQERRYSKNKNVLLSAVASLALAGIAATALSQNTLIKPQSAYSQQQTSANLLEQAVNDLSKRQPYLDSIVAQTQKPDYVVSIQYATPQLGRMLAKNNIIMPFGATAIALPIEPSYQGAGIKIAAPLSVGKETKSAVYILNHAFRNYSHLPINSPIDKKEFYEGLEVIMRNLISHNEYVSAKIFHEGIPHYPLDSFKDRNGIPNLDLYNHATTLLAHASEYNNLRKHPSFEHNLLVQDHASHLKEAIIAMYVMAGNRSRHIPMDHQFMVRFATDFNPTKLLDNNKMERIK